MVGSGAGGVSESEALIVEAENGVQGRVDMGFESFLFNGNSSCRIGDDTEVNDANAICLGFHASDSV